MTARIANIELAQTVLAAAAGNVAKTLDAAGGSLHDKLALALAAERELTEAATAMEASLQAARAAAAGRASRLRAEIREGALKEVAAMLRDGSVTLADVACRAGVAIEGNMTFERVAVIEPAPAAAAPAPVVVMAASGPQPSAEVRENLRLQAGYMHPVKFRDPATGAGWSGRGPTPKWLKALCVDGKTIEDFRVGATEPAAAPAATDTATAPAEAPAVVVAAVAVDGAAEAPVEAGVPAAEAAAAPAKTPAADCSTVEAAAVPFAEVAEAVETAAAPVDAALLDGTSDIGQEVGSFDASGMDSDLNMAAGADDNDDIGEFVSGIAAMGLDMPPGNAAQFLAAA